MIDFRTSMLLRTLADSIFTAKGAQLTWPELDTNQKAIANALALLLYNPVAALPVYDAGTSYVGGTTYYRSYNGNVWKFVSGSTQTGITPGSNSAVWELSSAGAFFHVRNMDTALALSNGAELTSDFILAHLGGGSSVPVTQFTLIGGDFDYDPDNPSDETTTNWKILSASGTKGTDGTPYAITGEGLKFSISHTSAPGMIRMDIPTIKLNGTKFIVTGIEGTTANPPALPSDTGESLTPIIVSSSESHKLDNDLPIANKSGFTGEVRSNVDLFAMWDAFLAQVGLTRLDFVTKLIGPTGLFKPSDTIDFEQGAIPNPDPEGDPLTTILLRGKKNILDPVADTTILATLGVPEGDEDAGDTFNENDYPNLAIINVGGVLYELDRDAVSGDVEAPVGWWKIISAGTVSTGSGDFLYQEFVGDGTTTDFTLDSAFGDGQVQIFDEGLHSRPEVAFTKSALVVSFASPPASGAVQSVYQPVGGASSSPGGGSFAAATAAEMRTGTNNTKGATPLRIREEANIKAPLFRLNVLDYGVKNDGIMRLDGHFNGTSFTSSTGGFTSAMTGMKLKGTGTGLGGADSVHTVTYVNPTTLTITPASDSEVLNTLFVLGSDNTAALQSVIDACANNSGVLYFPNGIYVIAGALGGSNNSQLELPGVDVGTATHPTLHFLGETPATFSAGSPFAEWGVSGCGVVLHSFAQGSGTRPSILSGSSPGGPFGDFTYIRLVVENITFRNQANRYTNGPTMAAINAEYVANFTLSNSKIDVDADGPHLALPTNTNAVGVYTPRYDNDAVHYCSNFNIYGYYVGLLSSEHNVIDQGLITMCRIGLLLGYGKHSQMIHRLNIQWCKVMVGVASSTLYATYAGDVYLQCLLLNLEHHSDNTKWYYTTYDLLDEDDNLQGSIMWHASRGIGGAESVFDKSGGALVGTQELRLQTYPFIALTDITTASQTRTLDWGTSKDVCWRLRADHTFTLALANDQVGRLGSLSLQKTTTGNITVNLPANSYIEGRGAQTDFTLNSNTENNVAYEIMLKVTTVDGLVKRYHWTISGQF